MCIPVTPSQEDNTSSGVYTIALEDGRGTRLLLVAQKYQNWFRGFVTGSGGKYKITWFEPKIMVRLGSLHNTARYYDLIKKPSASARLVSTPSSVPSTTWLGTVLPWQTRGCNHSNPGHVLRGPKGSCWRVPMRILLGNYRKTSSMIRQVQVQSSLSSMGRRGKSCWLTWRRVP